MEDVKTAKKFRGINGVKAADDFSLVTPEQAKAYANELRLCKNDIIHFAENWFYIISYRGKEKIKLYPKQKEIITTMANHPFSIILSARQSGKCVTGDSLITIRNKKTGKVESIPIAAFYKRI